VSIEIHCDHCGKLIRAPEGAGGKRGKCPYCEQSVYIPTPPDELEEIALAPLDDEEERRAEQLRDESIAYAAALDKATGPAYDVGSGASSGKAGAKGGSTGGGGGANVDVAEEVKRFVLAMSQSKLDETEAILNRLRKAKVRANDHVQGLLLDEMPPKIGNVPPALAKGFLKALGDRLSE
jgi:phage FluMu protein Com